MIECRDADTSFRIFSGSLFPLLFIFSRSPSLASEWNGTGRRSRTFLVWGCDSRARVTARRLAGAADQFGSEPPSQSHTSQGICTRVLSHPRGAKELAICAVRTSDAGHEPAIKPGWFRSLPVILEASTRRLASEVRRFRPSVGAVPASASRPLRAPDVPRVPHPKFAHTMPRPDLRTSDAKGHE